MNQKFLRRIGIASAAILLVAAGFQLAGYLGNLGREKVVTNITIYVMGIAKEKKLVLLSLKNGYTIEKRYSKKILMLDFDAAVRISVVADVNYYLDLGNPDNLKVRYDPIAKAYSIGIAKPSALYPSIHTDSVRVEVLDTNLADSIVLKIKRRVEELRADISDEVQRQALAAGLNAKLEADFLESFKELLRSCLDANGIGGTARVFYSSK